MEPLTVLAFGKFIWEVGTGIRDWIKEADEHPELITGNEKHNHVLKKVAEKVAAHDITIDNDAMMKLASEKIDEIVKAYKENGVLKREDI